MVSLILFDELIIIISIILIFFYWAAIRDLDLFKSKYEIKFQIENNTFLLPLSPGLQYEKTHVSLCRRDNKLSPYKEPEFILSNDSIDIF